MGGTGPGRGDLPDDSIGNSSCSGAVRPRQYSANRSSRPASRSARVTAIPCRFPARAGSGVHLDGLVDEDPGRGVDGMLEQWMRSLEPGGERPSQRAS